MRTGILLKINSVYHKHRKALLISLILMLLASILNSLFPLFLSRILENIKVNNGRVFMFLLLSFITWVLSKVILQYIHEVYEVNHIDFEIKNSLSKYSLKKLLKFSIGQHIDENSTVKSHVIKEGEKAIEDTLGIYSFNLIPLFIDVMVTLGFLLFGFWQIGCLMLLTVFVYSILLIRFNKSAVNDIEEFRRLEQEFVKHRSELLSNIKLVIVEAKEDFCIQESGALAERYAIFGKFIWKRFARFNLKTRLGLSFIKYLFFLIIIYWIWNSKGANYEFVMLYGWINSIHSDLLSVSKMIRQLILNMTKVERYFDMIEKQPDVVNKSSANPFSLQNKIEFRNVSFSYDCLSPDNNTIPKSRSKYAVENISFILEAGQKIAVIGESGSGKSTILQLLIRAFDPQHGNIYIDNVDIRDIDLSEIRKKTGYVQQNVELFDNSLEYNIQFGIGENGNSFLKNENLQEIIEDVLLTSFLQNKHEGIKASVGEQGEKLSGGERQRVSWARAILKRPELFLLDEATNSLDMEAAKKILGSFCKKFKNKTVFIVSHQIDLIKDYADRILVMNKGKIIGFGTHSSLIKECPYYKSLNELMDKKDQLKSR